MDAPVSFFTNHPPSEKELACWLEPGSVEKDRQLFDRAYAVKIEHPGPRLHLRFLLELSNVCSRDCLYCGVRRSNREIERYSLQPEVAMEVLRRAKSRGYRNIVLQAGERSDKTFTRAVIRLVEQLRREGGEDFRIVLSLGEQPTATYRDWKQAGADRYLLRIETSNPELYRKIHPPGSAYTLGARLRSLEALREAGFQTGTGVMIGLPFQTLRDLAADLLFFKAWEVDMVGMGPYLEHHATPLFAYRHQLLTVKERYLLSLRMIALLRCLMPDINIVASTALQSVGLPDTEPLRDALMAGANVMMLNVTPESCQKAYSLYENKFIPGPDSEKYLVDLARQLNTWGEEIALEDPGDPLHYLKTKNTILKKSLK